MEYFKIKVVKEKVNSKPKLRRLVLPYEKKLFKKTTNTIFNLIFRASDRDILEDAICIRVGKIQYYSLVKIAGINPTYSNLPVTINGVDNEPELLFKAKTYLTHEEDVFYVNKAESTPRYIP